MRPIGGANLSNIDHRNRIVDYGIMIGEKDCWRRGYGTEVTMLMLDYGFTGLGLHHVMLTVYDFNGRGIRAYTRAGFRVIGSRRGARRFGGVPHDEILMDCLATEFNRETLNT